jgi:hypothetical protein
MFTNEGRKAFLEFLRNLTPQILFLTLSLIWWTKIDLTTADFNMAGFAKVLPFAMCLLVFLAAMIANMGLFIDSAITSTPALDVQVETINSKKMRAWERTGRLLFAAWKHNKPAFFQVILVLAICEISLTVVFIAAIQGASISPFIGK